MRQQRIWKHIWSLNVANGVKSFIWRVCKEILPTHSNLHRRKIAVEHLFLICRLFDESVANIHYKCERAKDMWTQSYKKIQKLSLPPSSFLDIWSHLSTILDKSDLQGTSYTAKMLWTRRNEWVHQDKFLHPNLILSKALEEYISFLMAQTHSDLLLINL